MTEREQMHFDVVIVGAGPAGLAAAIRLKQADSTLSVVVVEKAAEVGGHILSGAVIDPAALDELAPDWRDECPEARVPVTEDRYLILGRKRAFAIPNLVMPPLLSNHGNFVVSLGNVCRWLAAKAEALGVEIYPGFAATELLGMAKGTITGIATGDMGLDKAGQPGPDYQQGMELIGRYTLLAEGCRGSLSKMAIARFGLDRSADTQKYGIGFKEIWQVDPGRHRPGLVQHSFGWPLSPMTAGGSFLYHMGDGQIVVGFVVHLNYRNPHLSPFEEFQRFKTHPAIKPVFEGAKRIAYGSRAISSGGYQSVPQLVFPGGMLVGDAAGFVNLPRIKGSHNAMRSGMLAADHLVAALKAGRQGDMVSAYDAAWRDSAIGRDLFPVRNIKPLFSKLGLWGGVVLGGIEMWLNQLLNWSPLGTLRHGKPDHACLDPAGLHQPIAYPKPDGRLTFDRLSSVFLSGTNHRETQPVHLRVASPQLQQQSEYAEFGGPSTRYCPAGVYEWIVEPTGPRFQINAQNCVHCKTCDIKDPNQNITWTAPEGGDGPNYANL
ncbi:electron transfer flavoprotein-ubiquinone oxidoreductase [Devosia sp. FKR38]|uniref:electron transfer flavoprotein-ubiquinone oxidoreductase n=1 Tax=Devosia sp. FKR38 TaxID=2562312 RepID=UPI0010C0CE8B|nr:electron transfer flavoprotein-ubiquinone oxidoreductase [Devosia sp. FKR38]